MIARPSAARARGSVIHNLHRSAASAVRKFSSGSPARTHLIRATIHCGNFRSGFVSCGDEPALRSDEWHAGAARGPEAIGTVGRANMERKESRQRDDVAKASPGDVFRQGWVRLSERVILHPGDRVRVSGGPYWEQVGADGGVTKTRMGERGVMVFEEYCQLGESRWVVARGQSGYAALHMGPEERSPEVPGLVRRPYRLRRIRPTQPRRKPNAESVRARARSHERRRAVNRKARP